MTYRTNKTSSQGSPKIFPGLLVVLLVLAPALAWAQDQEVETAAASRAPSAMSDLQPSPSKKSIFSLETSSVAAGLEPSARLLVSQLNLRSEDSAVIDKLMVLDASTSIGLLDRGEVSVGMPVYFTQEAGSGVLGDARVQAKLTLLDSQGEGLGLAVLAPVWIPVGGAEPFSAQTLRGRPMAVADLTLGSLILGLNAGAQIPLSEEDQRPEAQKLVVYGLGAKYRFPDEQFTVTGELSGRQRLDALLQSREGVSPVSGLIGVEIHTIYGVNLQMAGGGSFLAPEGNQFRIFTGLGYTEPNQDTDLDGLQNQADRCPSEPEDKDGFEDEDGCPDLDNDNDGVADTVDKCPAVPEDRDQWQDEDGCPDLDNDNDGVVDAADKCPSEPEDKDGFEDEDGCPDLDNDKDGVADAVDKCPASPGLKAWEGCTRVVQIHFGYSSSDIKKDSFPVLDEIALALKRSPGSVEIHGHTDDVGKEEQNLSLSQARARAVKKYLVTRGVSEELLVSRGFGEEKPAVELEGLEGQALELARSRNRRVEFRLR